jgi:hypothetical protein
MYSWRHILSRSEITLFWSSSDLYVPSSNNSKFSQISVKQRHQYVCLIWGKVWLISMIFPRLMSRFWIPWTSLFACRQVFDRLTNLIDAKVKCTAPFVLSACRLSIIELHLHGFVGLASHPDVRKIRIIGFFLVNRLHWQFEVRMLLQGGSNMTGTDLCVNKPHKSWSYLNHLVFTICTCVDHAWFEVLEARTLYCTWSDNR